MGNFREGSDIDLVIKGEGLFLSDLLKIETEIDELLLPYKVDLCLYSQIENHELIQHIQRVGKSFYSNSTEACD